MTTEPKACVVGATGVTGQRIARHAAEFGLAPVLAGRDGDALRRLAGTIAGAEVRLVDLARPDSLRDAVDGCAVVINCVAPFTANGLPVARAAVTGGVDYVDTTGEIGFCRLLEGHLMPEARERGARLVPAVAASSLPADFAATLALRQAGATEIESVTVTYETSGYRPSSGSIRSLIDILAEGAPHVVGGRLELARPGSGRVRVAGRVGVRMAVPDAFVISRYCASPRIEVVVLVPRYAPAGALLGGLSRLCRNGRARRWLQSGADRLPRRDAGDDSGRFRVGAQVVADSAVHAVTVEGEGVYRFTARAAALVASELAARPGDGGLVAPSQVVADVETSARALELTVGRRQPRTHRTEV